MTSFTQDDNPALYQIRGYKPGYIQVNDEQYTQSLIISAQVFIPHWGPQTAKDLTEAALEQAAQLKPEILLIGTGAEHHFLPLELYGPLLNRGIGVEIMTTAAACRTYTALSAEDRKVVAALLC